MPRALTHTPASTPASDAPTLQPRRAGSAADWSDTELLLLVRGGDPAAYGELYRRYEHEVRRFARSLVCRDDVDDVVAESFAKVLRAIDRGKGPVHHPARYLMVTVRTTAASLHRRRANLADMTHLLTATASTDGIEEPPAHTDPDLAAAFRSLQPRWRQVIWWSEIEGRSPTEIGQELGLNASAAAALTYRARRALRGAYAEQLATADPHS